MASGRTLASIPWIVLFTKHDIFLDKLKLHPDSFSETFPTFKRDEDKELHQDALDFIKQQFLDLNHLNGKKVLQHVTNLHDLSKVKSATSEFSDFLPANSIKREKQKRKKKEKQLQEKEGKMEKSKKRSSEEAE